MSSRLIVLVLIVWSRAAAADPCPPAASLRGDPGLVDAVARTLAARGIAGAADGCPAVDAELERRGGAIAVSIERDGAAIERVVDAPDLAATVIESWARTDVDDPLLAARPAPAVRVARAEAPEPAPPTVIVVAPRQRGIELFAAAETSLASDGTAWVGSSLGACVGLGPVCAAVRVRFANVVAGPDQWTSELDRRGAEVLVGGDLPFERGRLTITPGIATGLGWSHTHVEGAGWHVGSETGGLRADLHVALSVRLRRHLALDLALAVELTQATHVETNTTMPIPDEPRLLARLGAGVHFEGL